MTTEQGRQPGGLTNQDRRPEPRAPRRSRFAEHSLLRNPLPAIAAAITVFLVVLTLLVARLSTGGDPALRPLAAAPAVTTTAARGARRTVVRTTASGRSILTTEAGGQAVSGQAGSGSGARPTPPLTRASGSSRRDD